MVISVSLATLHLGQNRNQEVPSGVTKGVIFKELTGKTCHAN